MSQDRWDELLCQAAEAAQAEPQQQRRRVPSPTRPAGPTAASAASDAQRRAERAVALAHLGELSAARAALEASPLAPHDTKPAKCHSQNGSPAFPQRTDIWHLMLENSLATCVGPGRELPPGHLDAPPNICIHCLTTKHAPTCSSMPPNSSPQDVCRRRSSTASVLGGWLRYRNRMETYVSSLFQYALSTRAGTEALARALAVTCELSPSKTAVSVDGVGAYDHIARAAMFEGLRRDARLVSLIPFVRQFYGRESTYLFYDQLGQAHEVAQAEGGEQGDPLMPGLFAVGIHPALLAAHAELGPPAELYAFLGDTYVSCDPADACAAFVTLRTELKRLANIDVHLGKTRVWNSTGEQPPDLAEDSHLIAVNKGRYFQRDDGLALQAGPFVAALEFATGKMATVVGKPDWEFFHSAVEDASGAMGTSSDLPLENFVMIGDDVIDDVQGAMRAGMRAILVKT
eukprot:s10577_g1.t1